MSAAPGEIDIHVQPLAIPLTTTVTQASASRATTSSLLAVAERGRRVGLGEGCPRPYVTGETLEGAHEWCLTTAPALTGIRDLADLTTAARDLAPEIERNPAAWCTLELAVLDLLAQEAGCTVEALLGIAVDETTFAYTAVIDDSNDTQFETLKGLYAESGFSDFKLKVNGDALIDADRVDQLAQVGAATVRLDANNLWGPDTDQAIRSLRSIDGWWAVEEPLRPGDADGLSALAQSLQCSVVLDESLTSVQGVERFSSLPGSWVANVKVSKSGGMLRSLAIIAAAIEAGWPVIIGAQVGETSVLTRAGFAAARAAGPQLRAIEGGFGTWLLTEDPVSPTVMWGEGGILDLGTVDLGPTGWGLSRSESR